MAFADRSYASIQFYLDRGKWDEALAEIQNLLASRSDDAALWTLRSQVLRAAERPDEAIESAKRAIELDPEAAPPFAALALAALDKDRPTDALAAIGEAIERDPEDAGHRVVQAAVYASQKRWKEALDAATLAVELDPENTQALNLRSHALDRMGRSNEAEIELQKALRLEPENPQTYTHRGWVALTRGQPQEALENFREALRLDPSDDAARAGIAEAMRNRNFFYRIIYKYYDFMSRFTATYQWAFLIGYLMLGRVLRAMGDTIPFFKIIATPVTTFLLVFAFSTWLARPLMNMALFFDRYGYHALTRRDIYGAFLTTGLTLFAFLFLPLALLNLSLLSVTGTALIVACISATIFVPTGWRSLALAGITLALFVTQPGFVIVAGIAAEVAGHRLPPMPALAFWPLAAFGAMFAANWLVMSDKSDA